MTAPAVIIEDHKRVRTITFNRPAAMNAFNEDLYHAVTDALTGAASDPALSVVILTGGGRAFCAGTDLQEMLDRNPSVPFTQGARGFTRLMDTLIGFPKPLLCAVNGIGVGLGTTILGFADLAFIARTARLKCPFTSLGIAPEAASTYLLPELVGRQNASWLLMSSEWMTAEDAVAMGLAWRTCEPEELTETTRSYAERIAAQPLDSLIAVKRLMAAPRLNNIRTALARENAAIDAMVGGSANTAALAEFLSSRDGRAAR